MGSNIDTFAEWCEHIAGVDLQQKYQPLWAVVFSVSFDGNAIRDDFAKFLNESHMQKVEDRIPRMAWREGTDLHFVNLSSLMEVEPQEIIEAWKRGIDASKTLAKQDPRDACLYGTVTSLFENMHIHSMTSDALGRNWKHEITTIPTERAVRLGKGRL
jgi:hypothetical protein